MLVTYPDIYAAQRHHDQAVEPPTWDIIAPPFTPVSGLSDSGSGVRSGKATQVFTRPGIDVIIS